MEVSELSPFVGGENGDDCGDGGNGDRVDTKFTVLLCPVRSASRVGKVLARVSLGGAHPKSSSCSIKALLRHSASFEVDRRWIISIDPQAPLLPALCTAVASLNGAHQVLNI